MGMGEDWADEQINNYFSKAHLQLEDSDKEYQKYRNNCKINNQRPKNYLVWLESEEST